MAVTNPIQIDPQDYSFVLNGSAQNPLAAAYPVSPAAGTYPTTGFGSSLSIPLRVSLSRACVLGVSRRFSATGS